MLRRSPGQTMTGMCSHTYVRFIFAAVAFILFYYVLIHPLTHPSPSDLYTVTLPPIAIEVIMAGNPIPVPQLQQDDPRIINFIKRYGYLKEPSINPYNLTSPAVDPSMGQGQFVRNFLNEQRNGFFIECGALDGETRSNTLYLEKELGWKGLLVEADPSNYALVLNKQRKAWTSNSCLATKSYPHEVIFHKNFNVGKIYVNASANTDTLDPTKGASAVKTTVRSGSLVRVQCFPIYSLLSAMGVTTVDYFSLDVEGNEMEVLRAIPFHKVFIKTLSVEYFHDSVGKETIREFMKEQGYVVAAEINQPNNLANDFIFVHSSLVSTPSTTRSK